MQCCLSVAALPYTVPCIQLLVFAVSKCFPVSEKKVTYLCVVRLLLDCITVLEGLFGEYHSSSAALGKQRLGVTKQPPFVDWGRAAATPEHR